MNLKKILLGSLAVVAAAVSLAPATNAALNDAEFTSALNWAYENGLTKYNTEDAFNPYANITREQATKFFASYTVTNLCEVTSSESEACDFSDIDSGDYSLKEYIMLSCELGLVRGTGGKFMPANQLTRAEAFTILSRAMSANAGEDAPAEDGTPWYGAHFKAMQDAGVTKETNVEAQTRPITRYELLLALYRSKMDDAECSDTDVNDLLDELFGDDTTTDEDTTDDVVTESNGTAMAKLSSATPNGATVPGLVSVKVASFDFTASSEAVVLSEVILKRMGLGSDDTVDELTLFVNGEVVTKSKSFNSDDEVVFSLNPAATIEPGKTITVDVVAKVGSAEGVNNVSNQEFSIALVGFGTNGTSDTKNLPINANTFRIGGVDGALVVVNDDGNVSDVNLGDKAVEVAKFEMENQGDDNVMITQVTLEDNMKNADENLENFVLKHKGVTVGTVAKASGKYVTFILSTPVTIAENETEDFKVYADVIAGAGDEISFTIDQEIYVLGKDAKYGYGIAVDTTAYAEQTFSILAGELTLVEKKLPSDLARADRDDFVLAHFELIPNAGLDLSLEDIKFVLNGSSTLNGGADTWDEVFENAELQVIVNGVVKRFDLEESNGDADSVEFADTDLAVFLKATDKIEIKLVADTVTAFGTNWTDNDSFSVVMSTAFPGFEVIENEDDERVTKIVPSSITFDTVDLVTSEVDVKRLSLTNADVVIGSTNVDAVKFQVSADDAGAVYIQSFDFELSNTCMIDPDSNTFSAVKLWKAVSNVSGSSYELVEQQGGFDISDSGEISFDDFAEIEVLANKDVNFLLTVDVNDDDNLDGCTLSAELVGSDIEDDDNKDLTENYNPALGGFNGRNINVQGVGTLDVDAENDDPKADRTKHVLGGTTSDYVAAFELRAQDEGVVVNDMELIVAGAGSADFNTSIEEVILYKADGTELARETVSTTPVEFTDANILIPEGGMFVYVKVIAKTIGEGFEGIAMDDVTFAVNVTDAEGDNSGDEIPGLPILSPVSRAFDVIPVHVSNVAFVAAPAGTEISSGVATTLGTIEITANTWNNVDSDTASPLKIVLDTLDPEFEGATPDTVVFERTDISATDTLCEGAVVGNRLEINFGNCSSSVAEIIKGQTAKFRVKATFSNVTNSTSAKIKFSNINDGLSLVYESNDSISPVTVSEPRLLKSVFDDLAAIPSSID